MVRSGPFDGEPSPASIAKVTAWLEAEGRGRAAVNFRLRDWLDLAASGTGARRSRSCTAPNMRRGPGARRPAPGASCPRTSTSCRAASRRWRATRRGSTSRARSCGGDADARHRHDGHVRRLQLVLLPVLLARATRTGRSGARTSTGGCRRTSTPAASSTRSCTCCTAGSSRRSLLRHGHGRVRRAVPAADEPGPGDLRRRLDVEDQGQHRRADAARRAVGRRHDAADRCCSPGRSRTTSTGS